MTRKLLFTVTAAIALAGCSEGSPLEPQYAASGSRPVPAAPLDATMTVLGMSVEVRWVDNSANERRFEIQRRVGEDGEWVDYAVVPRNTTSYSDLAVDGNTRYRYRVRACVRRTGCSSWATTSSYEMPAFDPSAVEGITTTALSSTSVSVSWLDVAGDETYFEIERRTRIDVGTWAVWEALATPGADVTSLVDTTASPDTGYRYRVRECNDSGCSMWVTSTMVVTPAS